MGRFNASGPTVSSVYLAKNWDLQKNCYTEDRNALLFTSVANTLLNPGKNFTNHAIYVIPRASNRLFSEPENMTYLLVTDEIPWVSDLIYLEPNTPGLSLPFKSIITVSGRFPTGPRASSPSAAGFVKIINASVIPSTQIYQISQNDTCEWYYNEFNLQDINNDGLLDIITVRFRDVTCPPTITFPPYPLLVQFVAFLQPSTNPLDDWTFVELYNFNNTVNQGPTAFFEFLDLDLELYNKRGKHELELVSAEFFGTGALAIYYLESGNSWLDPNKTVGRSVVESSLGSMFEVDVADINNDGTSEIIATTHTTANTNGIYAYEIKQDFRNSSNVTSMRRPLYINFTVFGRPPTGARLRPGSFKIYYPTDDRNNRNIKPLISVGTDGGGQLLVLEPASQNKKNWDYNVTVIDQEGCDIIGPSVFDVNNDGYNELLAPCVRGSLIFLNSYRPCVFDL